MESLANFKTFLMIKGMGKKMCFDVGSDGCDHIILL